jgi:hypothetical protein
MLILDTNHFREFAEQHGSFPFETVGAGEGDEDLAQAHGADLRVLANWEWRHAA